MSMTSASGGAQVINLKVTVGIGLEVVPIARVRNAKFVKFCKTGSGGGIGLKMSCRLSLKNKYKF